MKKISAVICELNPAHEGHRFIMNEAKKRSEYVVAIMSGNFVQRAETAIYDKYERAKSAIDIGADLVFELPFPWSSGSAEYFASAGVRLAECIGADILVFGSESGDETALKKASEVLKKEEFNSPLPAGVRAAEYRQDLLNKMLPDLPDGLISRANDILGVEYCKNLKRTRPCPVKRISCDSASDIRKAMAENRDKYANATFAERLFDLEYVKLRTQRALNPGFAECGGGVFERLLSAASKAKNGTEMFSFAATKQYTDARLRRAALFALTEVTVGELRKMPEFTIVLASNSKGRELLSDMRKNTQINVLTKAAHGFKLEETAKKQFELSVFADSIYSLCSVRESDYYLKQAPIMI